jgi:DNA invertase Pin-like site-specific DNA recombinase
MLGIYTRLSKEDKDSTSIINQLREGKEFAEKNNYKNYQIYNEGEGLSGTLDIDERPEFSKLLNDIITGEVQAVWFRNQNRVERNSLTFHIFLDACKKTTTKIYHADKEFDYNDPNQLLTNSILSTLNAYSAQLQSHQTKKVLKSRIEQGKAHGVLAFGYTKDKDGYLKIDMAEATIVKKIYELSLSGMGTKSIAKWLEENEVPTRYNGFGEGRLKSTNKYTKEVTYQAKKDVKWSGNTVRNIITNTLNKGQRIWKRETYEAPSIVTPEYWLKVNENLSKNRNNSGATVKHKYLLKGLLRCGRCGRNYYGRSRVSKKDHYYQCSSKREKSCGNRSINIDRLEEYIWFQLFINGGIVEELKKEYTTTDTTLRIEELEAELINLNTKNNSFKSKIDNALELILEGKITQSLLEDKISTYEKQQLKLDAEIEGLNTNLDQLKNAKETFKEYHSEFGRLTYTTDFEQKKSIVNTFIKNIIILTKGGEYFLKIEFNIDIPPRGGHYIKEYGFFMPSSLDHLYLKEFEQGVTTNTSTSLIVW